ncbi:MAG: SUMF1/EgtB/PvdO family nonheme iron enzyme [Chloracidobacterium sp.]|nr:SUMF1/EgtB/PvdO family nonheme iron enzyme [Chloracidobacterium sp.]MCO5332982.1 SUMF1/EgtB/PvdO family nonheme iron enzyme [Pyrinomonadaceae bacterium]
MKKLILVAFFFVFALDAAVVIAQKRPVRKTTTPKPAVTQPQPQATPLPKPKSPAEQFYVQGLKCQKEDYDCQVSNYTKAINLELNTKAVFKNRGLAYMGKEEYGKAIGDLSKAIELDKNDAEGYKDRGKAYYTVAKSNQVLDMAIRDFTSAIELEPKDAEAYKFRGTAYFTRSRFDDAKADLEKSLSLNPKDADTAARLAEVRAEAAKSPAGAPNRPQSSDDKLAEFEAWSKTKNSTKAADYWEFLQTFANGAFAKQAYDKMMEIGDPEWNKVKDSRDPYQYKAYLEKNPNGPFSGLAQTKLKSSTDALIAWEQVDKSSTAAINEFIKKYPESKQAAEADAVKEKAKKEFESKATEARAKDKTNSIGMQFAFIPAGTFEMGEPAASHTVTISKDFYIGKYEVTQAQWQAVTGSNPSYIKQCGQNCPVEAVSWDDAQVFIAKLNAKNDGFVYSLPTEAQWEYAARAGTTGDYGGTGNLDEMGWYDKNSGSTSHPVGQKQPNAFGLYDMHGNVWEWCQDWYGDYPKESVTDPKGAASGQYRVLRGGSWLSYATNARSAYRIVNAPDVRDDYIGFRVVASVR